MGKYIDGSGLSHFMGILKGAFAVKADAVKNITRSGTTFTATRADGTSFTFTQQDNTVAKTTTTPKMDGTAAIGSETKYAAGDHVHPTDTSRVPTTRKVNGKALSADVTLSGDDIKRDGDSNETIADVLDGFDENFIAVEEGMASAFTSQSIDGVKVNGDFKAYRFATCSTAAATAGKTITLESSVTLEAGLIVYVKFANTNSAAVANLTLAITAPTSATDSTAVTTTAKPIKYRGANLPAVGYLAANRVYPFVYDGTNWELVGDLDTNTTYTNAGLGQGYGTCATAAATAAKAVTLSSYALVVGGVVSVKFTYGNSVANPTLNVNSKGAKPIMYLGESPAADDSPWDAGDVVTFIYDGTNYHLISRSNAQKNKNAFGSIAIGPSGQQLTISADAEADAFSIVGSNIGISNTVGTKQITFGITASNVTTALGNTAVARATGDADGNAIKTTYAKLASPALTGTPTAPTAAAGTSSTQIATTAFVANAVGTATAGALQYKGTVAAESTITGAAYKKGWYYVVSTAGTYVGKVCEVGDMLIAKQDKTSTPANDWDAVQSNIEVLSNSEIDALWAAA